MRRVAETLFRQWRRLADRAGRISILLWIADGSEILEYTGNPDDTFEWGYWQGIANPMPMPENPSQEAFRNYNFVPFRYREDAAPRTYGWLKRLIQVLREVGTTGCGGKPIRIGAAFDNGPEFSVSDFKYRRHREIAQAHSIYPNSFVTCDSVLHADPKPYAGFPEGIPKEPASEPFSAASMPLSPATSDSITSGSPTEWGSARRRGESREPSSTSTPSIRKRFRKPRPGC